YGLRRDLHETINDGNLVWRPFSQQGFIDDLASCTAVIAGGGFSLMSEAIYLGKPVLSVPLGGQFEQILNALWLQKLGYGIYRQQVAQRELKEFLERCPELIDNLKSYRQQGNTELFNTLDNLLAHICAQS
ncbi:MAG TPA: teichoic acid biosynthesis protein, partial [Myxococcales bacterium]|nr:teichoic acid biosynthesis protein [Myxococcales bacterium]